MNILLTGGCGYIGSHTAVALSEGGHNIFLLDNLVNSDKSSVTRIELMLAKKVPFVEIDVRDTNSVIEVLKKFKITCVIHFAGLKSVNESVENPLGYYSNNVQGTISLLTAMNTLNIKKIIFSSSATVYGNPKYLPIDESHPTNPTNPYGKTKLQAEEILRDLAFSDPSWGIVCLRYFNPVGAHESGLIGERPNGIPNNLLPYIASVGSGKLPHLNIYGNNYETPDGTGVRDYIHVMDLAEGHLAAVNYVSRRESLFEVINLGTGNGHSVLEILSAYELAIGKVLPHQFLPRREGDVAACFAKTQKAWDELHWRASRGLREMCSSVVNFEVKAFSSKL